MRRAPVVAIGLMLMSLGAGRTAAEQTAVLNSIHVSHQEKGSVVTFAVSGDIRFSSAQGKGVLRLLFSQMRPAGAATLQRRSLAVGPLQSIAFARPAADSIVATFALREGSTYRCVRTSGGNELRVWIEGNGEVRRGTTGAGAPEIRPALQKPVAATPPTAHSAPVMQAVGIPEGGQRAIETLVDIPAMLRSQLSADQDVPSCGPIAAPGRPSHGGVSSAAAVAVSAGVSLLATGGWFWLWSWFARRRRLQAQSRNTHDKLPVRGQTPARQSAMAVEDNECSEEDEQAARKQQLLDVLLQAEARSSGFPEELENGRETSLQLARTFKRGSEEVSLVRRLHEQGTSQLTQSRMESTLSRATTAGQQLQAARKLGVGRGEFDLARKLRSIAQAQEQQEMHP